MQLWQRIIAVNDEVGDGENVVIPDVVTEIGRYAFCGRRLQNLKMPDKLTTIADYAFAMADLKEVVIPSSACKGNNRSQIGCILI